MVEVKAYSIKDFCKAYSVSRQHFYAMEKIGKAPQTLQFGRRRLITLEAVNEWQARLEAVQNGDTMVSGMARDD